jgi:hypothetical protein
VGREEIVVRHPLRFVLSPFKLLGQILGLEPVQALAEIGSEGISGHARQWCEGRGLKFVIIQCPRKLIAEFSELLAEVLEGTLN